VEIKIIIQGVEDPPQMTTLKQPIVDLMDNDKLTVCVIERGMVSGEPAVAIISENNDGSFIMQTSLDKFLSAASGMATAAESRWGWKRPEGHATIMPPDPETRKLLLEAMIAELREYDDLG
jgi:hypothetical protein